MVYKPGKVNANADALSRNPVNLKQNVKENGSETKTQGYTAINSPDLKTTDSVDNTFTLRDQEQILAIDGTVSALDFEPDILTQYYNDILVKKKFHLFTIENYDVDPTNDTNSKNIKQKDLEYLEIGSGRYETAEEGSFLLIRSSDDRNICTLREMESHDSLDYEPDSREPPGRVDATNVLPPWPEVERHLYPE